MRFVDAHIHLSDEEYTNYVDEIIKEANNSNVVALVSISMDLQTSQRSLELAQQYFGIVYAALGVHPWNVSSLSENELQKLMDLISAQKSNRALVAIGEVGLDHKYTAIWDKQLMVFDSMLHLAERLDLQVIINSRGTSAQIVEMMQSYKIKKVLLNWFSNPISALTRAVENGYDNTEGPPTAYSNGIREVVRRVPLTRLLTETDGPVRFFKEPFNGKRTTPAFIPTVAKAIAEAKNLDLSEVTEQIAKNFEDFFGVKLN